MLLNELMINKILNFWFPNDNYNAFWFKKDILLDGIIFNDYYPVLIETYNIIINYDMEKLDYLSYMELLAVIILFDQFSRNMKRIIGLEDEKINELTEIAKKLTLICINKNYLDNHKMNYLVFTLMPLRHTNNKEDYEIILNIINKLNVDNEILSKFKNQTEKRYNDFI